MYHFGDACFLGGLLDGGLEDAFKNVMSLGDAGAGIYRKLFGWEYVLPAPFLGGVGVFLGERIWQVDGAVAFLKVLLVQLLDFFELRLEVFDQFGRQGDGAVLFAFAFADGDLVAFEVDVLDAQADEFDDSSPGGIHEFGHETLYAGEVGEETGGFVEAEDDGELFGAFGTDEGFAEVLDFDFQDVFVEEHEGTKRLILGGGGYIAIRCKVREESADFGFAHFGGVPLVVE